jgi:hypothetical protein
MEAARSQIGDATVRHVLRERWAPGPLIGWAGMNPSDASAERTDPTWMRWRGFAMPWGYGGQIVINPVPFRSPSPDEAIARLKLIAAGRDESGKMDLAMNRAEVRKVAAEPVAWVIGWGDKGAAMDDAYRVHRAFIEALRDGGAQIFLTFGLTKNRNPKHVLARGTSRIPDDAPLFDYFHTTKSIGRTLFSHASGFKAAECDPGKVETK